MRIQKIIIFSLIFLVFSAPIQAKKKLPLKTAKKQVANIWVKPKLRGDKNALLLMLGGMQYARSVEYNLTYVSDGIGQGAQGSHNPEDGNTIKELLFGTCSNNDCSYHQNITDMALEVIIGLQTGETLTQRYQITP